MHFFVCVKFSNCLSENAKENMFSGGYEFRRVYSVFLYSMYFKVCNFVKRFEALLSGKRYINVSLLLLVVVHYNYKYL